MDLARLLPKRKLTTAALIAIFASPPAPSFAQSFDDEQALLELYGDEEMISIATGNAQPIAQAPAVATVITAAQIEAMGATDLDEVLETVPGLHVARNALSYNPIYVFRGIFEQYNPQVLVLVNGIPITNLFHGDRNLVWGGFPIKSISRIEIIRGPGSAVYGADAFAGVINISMKGPDDIHQTEVGGRIGSYSTRDAWLLASSEKPLGKFSLTMEYHKSDGQDEVIEHDMQTNLDFFDGTDASQAPGPVALMRENLDARFSWSKDRWHLRLGYQGRHDLGTGAGVAEALDPYARYSSDRWSADLTYRNSALFDDWDLTSQISFLSTSQENTEPLRVFPRGTGAGPLSPDIFPDGLIGAPEVFEKHYRFDVSAFYDGIPFHTFRLGAGYANNLIDETKEMKNFGIDPVTGFPLPAGSSPVDVSDTAFVFLPEDNRENSHIYLQDVWNLADDWELTAGIRYDRYTDFGGTTNPRAALVWSATQNLTIKWLYGRAFRAPSFAETRAINNPVVLGNPDLNPEVIESYEMAFDYHPSTTLRLALNVFDYNWKDIIEFVRAAGTSDNVAQNVGRQSGYGAELEGDWKIDDRVSLMWNYSWANARDEQRDAQAAYSPKQQLFIASQFDLNRNWHLYGQANWVMDRERFHTDPRDDIDDYVEVNLALSYVQNAWEAKLKVNNAFDSDLREPSLGSANGVGLPHDLPLPGRNYFLQLTTSF